MYHIYDVSRTLYVRKCAVRTSENKCMITNKIISYYNALIHIPTPGSQYATQDEIHAKVFYQHLAMVDLLTNKKLQQTGLALCASTPSPNRLHII